MKASYPKLGLIVLGVAAAAAFAWITVTAEVEDQARVAADEVARTTALAIESELDRIERQVAWLLRPGADTTQAADTAFILDTTPAVSGLRLIDGQGRTLYAATRAGFARDTTDAAHTRAVLAADPERPWVSPVRRLGDQPHADLALMRRGDPAVAIADLDLAFFGDVLDAAAAAPGTRFALADEAGTPIAGGFGSGQTTAVPIPRANWVLRVTPPASSVPLVRLAERFAAFGAGIAAAAALGRRLVPQR